MAPALQIDDKVRSNYKKYASRISMFRLDPQWLIANDPLLSLQAAEQPDFDFLGYYLERQAAGAPVSPNPLFDWSYYRARTNYEGRLPRTPIEYDFLTNGADRNATALWLFRNEHFAGLRPGKGDDGFTRSELKTLRRNYGAYSIAFLHNIERFERASPLFSMAYYRMRIGQPDLDNRATLIHYLSGGHLAGVHGSPLFDDDWYRARYGEGISVGSEAHHAYRSQIQQFLGEGIRQGASPVPDFDADFYLQTYPEAAEDIGRKDYRSPIDHFLGHLRDRTRRPNPYFDPVYYLEQYPNAAGEMDAWGLVHPLEHFLHAGYGRGYRAALPLSQVSIPEASAKAVFERRAALTAAQRLMLPQPVVLAGEGARLTAIVPVYNHFDFTAALLVQMEREYGPGSRTPVKVVVVDNGSTDRTTEIPTLFPDVDYVRLPEPVGYTAACNAGAARASSDLLIFLNNDIDLGPRVFDLLVEALDADPGCAAVGPKIMLLDGTVQEAGGVVFVNGGTAGFGRGMPPDRAVLNVGRDVDYVSGCALAVRRSAFEAVGGFDELFSPGYFEDVDLCLRLWEAGQKVRYVPQAWISHYEYGTYSKGRPKEISYFRMYANKAKFLAKHRDGLIANAASVEDFNLTRAAFRRGGAETPMVLMIEDLAPSAMFGSGFVRSEDVVRAFVDRGYRVTVLAAWPRAGDEAFVEHYRGRVDLRHMQKIGLTDLLRELGDALNLVWVCRTHNIANLKSELIAWRQGGPQRRLVGDTEALASLRGLYPGMSPAQIAVQPGAVEAVRQELEPAAAYDEIVCVNGYEAGLARAALPGAAVGVLGHSFETAASPPPFAGRRDFILCGAIHEAFSPNMDSLRWFCADILPLIRQQLPGIGFSFVGYVRDNVALPAVVTENTRILGRVDELAPVFDAHRVFVAPTRLAAGVPHKVQQSMALGLPCVITSNLAGQLEEAADLQPFVPADIDAADFAAQCVRLYQDEALWTQVQADGLTQIRRFTSADAFSRQLDLILDVAHG